MEKEEKAQKEHPKESRPNQDFSSESDDNSLAKSLNSKGSSFCQQNLVAEQNSPECVLKLNINNDE